MKKENVRKIILACILLIIVSWFGFKFYIVEKEYINDLKQDTYYDEEDVENLEYILENYYSKEYTEEDLNKAIIFGIKEGSLNNLYNYRKDELYGGLQNYINEKITNAKKDRESYSHDITANDQEDYHTLALTLLKDFSEQEKKSIISHEYIEINDGLELALGSIFFILYACVVLGFIFLTIFDSKTYIKKIIKYIISLVIITILMIIITYMFEIALSKAGFMEFINDFEIYKYGYEMSNILILLIIIIVSIFINCLLNIKEIIKYFKNKKVAKK